MFKDVLLRMDLASAPVLSLLLFVSVFGAVCIWLLRSRAAAHFDRMGALPLDDDKGER